MDDGFDFTNPAYGVVFSLERRIALARKRIDQAKTTSRVANVGLGLLAFVPFPGAATVSLGASILAQAAFIVPSLTSDLGKIYLATPDELKEVESNFTLPAAIQVSGVDIGSELSIDILEPIISDLLVQYGAGAAATLVPVLGAVAAIGIDVFVVPKLTENIGKMVSIFYQNNGRWLNDSQQETYEAAKNMGGDLNEIRKEILQVRSAILQNVKNIVHLIINDLGKERTREVLREKEFPEDIIDEALAAF